MSRPSPCRSLGRVLAADVTLAQWTARARAEAALTRLVRRSLPRALGERVRVAGLHDGVLELTAAGGTLAAALRQRAGALPAALARDGVHVAQVRVRVHVAVAPAAPPPAPRRDLDVRAAAPLLDLPSTLSPGPLRDALARWSRRARGR